MNAREFMTAVINANVDEELTQYAQAEIAKMDATNEKRKAKAADKRAENAPFIEAVVGLLNDAPKTAGDLLNGLAEAGITEIDGKAITVQKVSVLARAAVAQGNATQVEIKVAGKGKQKAYLLPTEDATDEDATEF